MVSWMLAAAGLDPTIVIGGKVDALGGNAKLGKGEFLVAEADESDGSFLKLSPVIEVVTNIDLEHLDYYRDLEHIKSTFLQFIDKIPFYGAAIVCLDDVNIADILPSIKKRTITYGLTPQADIYADDIAWQDGRVFFTVKDAAGVLGRIGITPPESTTSTMRWPSSVSGWNWNSLLPKFRPDCRGLPGCSAGCSRKGR